VSQYPPQLPQYPTPYEPPRLVNYRNARLPNDLLAPARRAAMVMFIVGGLVLLFALLLRSAAWHLPDEVVQQSEANWPQAAGPKPSVTELRTSMSRAGALFAVAGGVFVGLAFFVQRGEKVSGIITIAVSGLAILWLLLVAVSLFIVGGANLSGGVCALCLIGVVVPVFGIVIRFILISFSASRGLAAYRQHLALQQMYLHQQQFTQPPGSPAAPIAPDAIPDYDVPPTAPPPNKPA
jgi:hypothetical protein